MRENGVPETCTTRETDLEVREDEWDVSGVKAVLKGSERDSFAKGRTSKVSGYREIVCVVSDIVKNVHKHSIN